MGTRIAQTGHQEAHPRHGPVGHRPDHQRRHATLFGRAAAGATITIRDNGKVIGTATANAAGKWKFTTKALKDGAHNFTAKATLGYDVSDFSHAFRTVIDSKAPARPTLTLDPASDSGASATDGITNDATLTLAGTAEAGAHVTLRDGGTVLGVAKADAAGQWTLTTAALSDGVHNLTATAIDRAGNVGPASLIRTVTIDTAAPRDRPFPTLRPPRIRAIPPATTSPATQPRR